MARPVHSLSYPSIFITRNYTRRRSFKSRAYSTAAQAVDNTLHPPRGLSKSLLEINRSIIRKSISAEELTPVKNAILKPLSNPFAGEPLNYDSMWYDPPTFNDLIDSHLDTVASYEHGNSYLRVSAKRYLYFVKALLSERALPWSWKLHALDRVVVYLSRQHRASLKRPRRRRSPGELLDRNERLLILLNAICAEVKQSVVSLPSSLVELGLEIAVECRNFPACMFYLQRHCEKRSSLSTTTFKKVLAALREPPQAVANIMALRTFRTWGSTQSVTVLIGAPEGSTKHAARLSLVVGHNDPALFKLWLKTLGALSRQSPDSSPRLIQQLRREWEKWRKSLRTAYENGYGSDTGFASRASSAHPKIWARTASELDRCFLESFVEAGAYSDAWIVLFSTNMAFKALSPGVRRALMENPEFTPPESWKPEHERQVLSIYAEYCRAIEGALGVQWVRDVATGECFHRISTAGQRARRSRASKWRLTRRVPRRSKPSA
ncbi:hypothetical protein IWX49DRAFT_291103 [Phyllosticta citricarpa]|uniref:Uncharacterized protein n=2 Tax=Phyllosticta TaxID=121621 RepID=A0ABR1MNF2_9PEZI